MNLHPHLLVCISGHGYGHVAQTAPVLNALSRLMPGLKLTIRTSVPLAHLKSRITAEFHHIDEIMDPGMEMVSALEVDPAKSMQSYADFHAEWEEKVAAESRRIAKLAPDLVLSNVAYLPLQAAAQLEIPSIAMCSLNWADIFGYFCGKMPGAQEIVKQIEHAYLLADTFLRLTPAMPMPWLTNRTTVAPVAKRGSNRRAEINRKLGLDVRDRLVLVSMGGIAMELAVEHWPCLPHVHWLLPGIQSKREDMSAIQLLGMDFSDITASCDLLLTKPGYGAFVEAACSGIPVLYVKRAAWPEQGDLIAWLNQHGSCAELIQDELQAGAFGDVLQELLTRERPCPVTPSGTEAAAEILVGYLEGRSLRSISMASP